MCSLGGTCKCSSISIMGTCCALYYEHILHVGRFKNGQSVNLPVCMGNCNFEKPRPLDHTTVTVKDHAMFSDETGGVIVAVRGDGQLDTFCS